MGNQKSSLRGPATVAMVPFFLALTFTSLGTRPAPATVAANRPSLAFAEYVVNMGPFPVQPRPISMARFQFTNTSDQQIQFFKETPSCGCLSPKFRKRVWEPGETGDVYLRVQTAGQKPGQHEYTLHLEYGSAGSTTEDRSECMLTYRVVFPEQKVSVSPRSLMVYQLGNKPVSREVIITDMRGDTLEVESIEVHSTLVKAKLLGQETDPESGTKQFKLEVEIGGSAPSGDSRALVHVHTNDKSFPVVQVPILIRGPKQAEGLAVRAEPELMVLAPAKNDESKLVGQLQLTSGVGDALKVRSVKADPPVIQASFSRDKSQSVTVSATVDQEFVTGFNRGTLTVETDEPGQSRIEIPVMLRTKKTAKKTTVEHGPPEI